MHRKWFCIPAALICLVANVAFARSIFLTSTEGTNPALSTYSVDPFTFGTSLSAVGGVVGVFPSPNAQKFYLVSRSATDTVVVLEGRFPNVAVTRRVFVGGEAIAADMTSDGRRLVVVGTNGVSIIDTASDNPLVLMGVLDVGTNPIDVAVSADSSRAYVLSGDSSRLTAINLAGNTVDRSVQLRTPGTSVAVSPGGVVYVSGQNVIYELDPVTLATRAPIAINGSPDVLQFSRDGRFAVARSTGSFSTRAAFLIDLTTRKVTESTTLGFTFTDVAVVDNSTAYGISPQGALYVIGFGTDNLSISPAQINGTNPGPIQDIAASGELPRSRFLILSAGNYLYRLDTSTNQISDPVFISSRGSINVLPTSGSSGAAGVVRFNSTQTVPAGGTSLPLVVQAFDQNGEPNANTAVQFSTSTPGVTFSSASSTTNFGGIATTTVTIPASLTSGTVTINASVANQSGTTFTINVGDPGLPGPGTGTGTNVITGLQIIAGQGEAIPSGFSTSIQEPLTVKLYDNNGNPVPNSPVTWTLVQGSGNVIPLSSSTNSEGTASANFTSTPLAPAISFLTNVIRASAGGQDVTFYVTSVQNSRQNTLGTVNVTLVTPVSGIINAPAGSVIPNAIQFQVTSTTDATRLPFIGLKVASLNVDPLFGATAQCRNTFALSDANGIASCDLVVGPTIGPATLRSTIGSQRSFDNITLNVTVGAPANIIPLSGSLPSGNPGQQTTLQVDVRDAGNNALPNTQITWEIPSNVNVSNLQTQTDINGRASVTITFPSTPGPFVIRARAGNAVGVFNLTTNAVAGRIIINPTNGGDQQIAITGQNFGQPLSVVVQDAQGRPLPSATVTFNVASGSATVSSTSATTDANGVATASVTAGSTAGPVVITATSGSTSVNFNLTVRLSGPSFTASSFLNAAGFQPGISPGSIAYIRAAGIAPNLRGSVTPPSLVGPLPTRLSDVQVLFNNIASTLR